MQGGFKITDINRANLHNPGVIGRTSPASVDIANSRALTCGGTGADESAVARQEWRPFCCCLRPDVPYRPSTVARKNKKSVLM